jgi:hypothetical protein
MIGVRPSVVQNYIRNCFGERSSLGAGNIFEIEDS